MGEIAEMMLDGTLCAGCGEYLDREAKGFPGYCSRQCAQGSGVEMGRDPPPSFKCPTRLRAKIEKVGKLVQHDAYHWTVRSDANKVLAEWWPHKRRWRMDGVMWRGDENDFLKAIQGVK